MTESNSPEVLYIALALIGLLLICVFVIVVLALVVAKHRRKAGAPSILFFLNPLSRIHYRYYRRVAVCLGTRCNVGSNSLRVTLNRLMSY